MEAVTPPSSIVLTSQSDGARWWVDPSQEPSAEGIVLPNPLVLLNDLDLEGALVATHLTCGRSHSSFKRKHRQYVCGLHFALKVEKLNRDALKS